jgi:GrpB-like predicted nucleotidyltransferase (UPF0157 family)
VKKEELGQLYPVMLSAFNAEWLVLFEKEKNILADIWGADLRIEHIGSTAVPGLAAKPTIDILMQKPPKRSDERIITVMTEHGYIHMKEQTRHVMFVKGYGTAGLEKESYHVHMGPLEQEWLWDRLYFRDYLKAHPEEARRYETLKQELAATHRHDREAYTEGKAGYINRITDRAKHASR